MVKTLLIFMFSLLLLLGCKKTAMPSTSNVPKYEWIPSESAPKEYVMKILSGHFELADGSQKGIPIRVVLDNGWGTGRSNIAEGESVIALPAPCVRLVVASDFH